MCAQTSIYKKKLAIGLSNGSHKVDRESSKEAHRRWIFNANRHRLWKLNLIKMDFDFNGINYTKGKNKEPLRRRSSI